MKVITAKEMTRIEKNAYAEGASEYNFMEHAGLGIANYAQRYIRKCRLKRTVTVLCGKGNNAGDGYVAASFLRRRNFAVKVFQLYPLELCSKLCRQNYRNFIEESGEVDIVETASEVTFSSDGIIIDGIFGTGFHGEIEGLPGDVIKEANYSRTPVISIDIPSGIDGNSGKTGGIAIKATWTIFLGLPKTGFFLENAWNFIGKCYHFDFGLERKYIEQAKEDFILLTADTTRTLIPEIAPSRHKYQAGYVVGLAGSQGMAGAAMLTSLAALRGGAGIVRLIHPEGMEVELAASPYELVKESYSCNNTDHITETLNKASATLIGPGIGRSEETTQVLKIILQNITKPCVIDADALNIIATMPNIALPKNTILTPHTGEMHRLLGLENKESVSKDFMRKCQKYCEDKGVVVVLKGAVTYIFQPQETIIVNCGGDPGMATAGSGDVLTGMIAALLSQGLSTKNAAIFGVFLHSLAGDAAAKHKTPYGMIASDIIENIPSAWKTLCRS